MQIEVQNSAFKKQRLTVLPASWFKGPQLLLNGTAAPRKWGRYKVADDSGNESVVQLKYNYLDPIPKVKIGEDVSQLATPLRWYEYAWIGAPIILIFSGGAIGGLVGALGANASGKVFRSERGALAKYGLSAVITVLAFVMFVVLATIFQLLVGTGHK